MTSSKKKWTVYILECQDGSLYSGITTDMERRLAEHNGIGARGARYTRARRPLQLVHTERFATRSAASIREAALKKLTRSEKLALIKRNA
ncbi:MAG TPA: GIY-YIG nuclease family protein [Candidatus Paceibacterota bacterium]|nr:GIY-YIG nuclease family protein [Candidatus Paceibacterota bacterium]